MESLRYKEGELCVLDQLQVPHSTVWIDVRGCEDAWTVIRRMQVSPKKWMPARVEDERIHADQYMCMYVHG
jgi:hypothetical protein